MRSVPFSEDFRVQPRSCPLGNTGPVLRGAKDAGPVSNGGLKFISSGKQEGHIKPVH